MKQSLYDFKKKSFQLALRRAVEEDADPDVFKNLCLGYARINKLYVPIEEARITYSKINELLQIVYELMKMRPLKRNSDLLKLKDAVKEFAETAQKRLSHEIVELESLLSEVTAEEEESSAENSDNENKD